MICFIKNKNLDIMVPGDRSCQTQYFVKIFPSPLASTLHIQFCLHLKESSENAFWKTIALKSANFSAPESAPKTVLETTNFTLFFKNLTKKLEKKVMIVFCSERLDQFYRYFFPCLLRLLLLGEIPQPCMAGEKLCLWSSTFISLSRNTSESLYLLKNYH